MERSQFAEQAPTIRGAIAVLVARFPRIEETFILQELEELELQGQPLILVPVIGDRESAVHEEARTWAERALYIPLLDRSVAASNLRCFLQQPKQYLVVLIQLIAATILNPRSLIRGLGVFPKAVHLSRWLPELGVRHVHAHAAGSATTIAWIASSLSDITYSFTVYGPDVFVHPELLRQKIRDATFVRAVSVFVKAFLTGLHPVIGEGKIRVVHSGVKPDVYEAASKRAALEPPRPQILAVAVASPATRGLPFLVEACAQLARSDIEFDCRIINAAPLDHVRDLIEDRGLTDHVHLIGPQPLHEVARLIGEAAVFVQPGVITPEGQMEGIPLPLVQAMAAGKPVVAPPISGIPELVNHGVNGFIVDSTHAERIATALHRLLGDPSIRERLGSNARLTVRENFDVQRTAGELVSLFDRQVHLVPPTTEQRVAALDWARLGAVALGIRKVYDRADSSVVEVTITDGVSKRDVIVRRHRDSWDGSVSAHQRARAEFEALSILRHLHGGTETESDGQVFAVPAVLMFDEEQASVVVARAEGQSLAGMISDTRLHRRWHRVEEALQKSGRWLAVMQHHTAAAGSGPSIIEAIRASALADLELAAAGDFYLGRQYERIAATLRALDIYAFESAPVTGHHGAFSPHNIFVSDRGVEVTDFGRYRDGLALEDPAHLLVELELALSRSLDRKHLPHLQQLFLDAWAGEETVGLDALRFLMSTDALHVIAHSEDELSFIGASTRRRVLLRIIERGLRR